MLKIDWPKQISGRTLQYMVKWRGYPDTDNTWESAKDLPKNLIKKFADQVKLRVSTLYPELNEFI